MIRQTTEHDYPAVCALLRAENLPTIDLLSDLPHFLVKTEGDDIVGSIGLEIYGKSALLRSMMVAPAHRNKGIAIGLVRELTTYAKERGINKLFLITNTAENYFQRHGFVRVSRENVEPAVLQSKEFNGLCPSSSAIMMKNI